MSIFDMKQIGIAKFSLKAIQDKFLFFYHFSKLIVQLSDKLELFVSQERLQM